MITIVFVLTSSVFCAQEIQQILNQAAKHEESGEFEQARYYYAIAKERDTTDKYKLNLKLFDIDSVLLFGHTSASILDHIVKGDSAFFQSDHLNALTYYINSGETATHYVRSRIEQIVYQDPEMKLKLLVLMAKNTVANSSGDSLNISNYIPDSMNHNPSGEDWEQSDSTWYIEKFKNLTTNNSWRQAQDLVIGQILVYGHRMIFNEHLTLLYKIRLNELDRNENSLLLKLERIERIEQSDIPDEKEINRILNEIDCNRITTKETRKKFEDLKKRYSE